MILETKFDVGDRVVWRTPHNQGYGTVTGISINVPDRPIACYRVKIDDLDLTLQFEAGDLEKYEEYMI